ncbi:uncharacterized protein LOC126898125 [Daktulosphaira vitifoliae]|uniref:uncharacterized protein LOC126898125 n=1 Tax=Daktulosphaira vitifoliae TaxID=58002 RepID=UPI0021A97C9D|nr:uncharacterized protein LOC126898125 [Daktulosphaira vitifoliae]
MKCIGSINKDKDEINRADYYYLPHSYVLNDNSHSTRLRVVFNGTSKTNNGLSLNCILMNGPKIQSDLLNIVVRFRTQKYVFSAGISKLYRQILIHDDDHNYQRILWRSNQSDEINIYKLCIMTYGLVHPVFLAIGCINRISEEVNALQLKEVLKMMLCRRLFNRSK